MVALILLVSGVLPSPSDKYHTVAFWLHLLTNVTQGAIFNDSSLHPWPSKYVLEMLVHLRTFGAYRVLGIVSFSENQLLKLFLIRHTNPLLRSQCALITLGDVLGFTTLHLEFDPGIVFLGFTKLILQGWLYLYGS